MTLVYLDNNATTKVDSAVLSAMMPFFEENYGNPSSIYEFSRSASRAVQNARGQMKDFFNAEDEKNIILLPRFRKRKPCNPWGAEYG